MAVFLKGHRFYNVYRNLKANTTGFACYDLLNQHKARPFVHNVNRSLSLANLNVSENEIKMFLNYLVNAYNSAETTYFGEILECKSVQKLIIERIDILENIENLMELVEQDQELKKLAEEEKLTYMNRLVQIDSDLIDSVLEYLNDNECNDIILEISAGVGGQESMLFVKDLFDMYEKHISYLGYSYDIIHLDESPQGGLRHISIMISGEGCFQKLIHEAGVHRVQRVPSTEKSGRVHTSVVSVVVLPQPNDIEVVINSVDLKIDTMRASGAGGQHVNTTDSAVRITHLPTGTVSECQVHRSQMKNREVALLKLRTKLYDQQFNKEQKSITSLRKQQMGKRERNEKIRTYNYTQDRITDHRLSDGTLHNLKSFLTGGKVLDDLHKKLEQHSKHKLLFEVLKKM